MQRKTLFLRQLAARFGVCACIVARVKRQIDYQPQGVSLRFSCAIAGSEPWANAQRLIKSH